MKTAHSLLFTLLFCLPAMLFAKKKKSGEYYQITVYHFATNDQQKLIDQYLRDALVPALHQSKIANVGVFMPMSNDTSADKRIFVFFPVQSLQQAAEVSLPASNDKESQSAGSGYNMAAFDHPAYSRMEKILLKAFPMAPLMQLPVLQSPRSEHVYELRSYESATENLHVNKVQMFNEGGEVNIFSRLRFNPVFYASVIAGSRMPNLMYMTSFENMADRDSHWKSFGSDPEWKKLSALPGYQHNVSKSDIIFLKAADYSDY